ncbi:DUF6344 domain-containing protein [Phaeacidiphilus oryzae]|uniref:DUF6344 domain-containing protein n=1 Tax=Phaeacidiphilus oryzae TaxID=348818 RepID=UPI00055E9655|nr:DUF6344 domain-containing protein [Phaeacidiphilus oryzae]
MLGAEFRTEAVGRPAVVPGGGTGGEPGAADAGPGALIPGQGVRSAAAVRPPRQTVFSDDPAARRRWRKWKLPPTMKQRIRAEAHGATPACRTLDPSALEAVGSAPTARSRSRDEELCGV